MIKQVLAGCRHRHRLGAALEQNLHFQLRTAINLAHSVLPRGGERRASSGSSLPLTEGFSGPRIYHRAAAPLELT